MEKLMLLAKPGHQWSEQELEAFNIQVKSVRTAKFFDSGETLPMADVSDTILGNFQQPVGPLSEVDRKFFRYMQHAESTISPESAVDDFARFLISSLSYDHNSWLLRALPEMVFKFS
jgi:hypothetical protein